MSEIKQIADAYGLSYHSVKKWPKAKRDEAIRNLQAGVNPIVAELVGELQRECYVATQHIKKPVSLYLMGQFFDVWVDMDLVVKNAEIGAETLQGAIVKVQGLYK